MKHVTIQPPSPDGAGPVAPTDDPSSGNGLTIPLHMISSGEDGYRTPTGEDFDLASRQPYSKRHEDYLLAGATPIPPPAVNGHPNGTPNGALGHHSATASTASLGERLFEALFWRERIRHFTWTFFTLTMATGGIANVIYTVPFRFPGLYAIGVVFFLLNLILFIMNVCIISLRFYMYPEMFKASILHPTERLFIPAAVVSFGTILLNISQYGPNHGPGHWLNDAVVVLFWTDAALAVLASMGVYLVMWSTASFTIREMTPVWIFPAYPLLIIGPHAGVLSIALSQKRAFSIIVGGFTLQGIGFMVSLMIYSAFIYRLMTQKLPQEATRPGMFVSVGPCGFTAAGIIAMTEGAERAIPANYMGDPQMAALIVKVVGSWASLWIWGLALWFFFISAGSHYSCVHKGHHLTFTMTWFSYVFPQTALVTATFAVGRTFESKAIQIIGCIMTPLLIATWFVVVAMMIRAILLKQILWPQKGEDKDEGGFRGPRKRSESV